MLSKFSEPAVRKWVLSPANYKQLQLTQTKLNKNKEGLEDMVTKYK